ncbi:MAG: hypothetical protein MN733_08445 [Nitrososphaera sp.]|nr:hypothetical protein [Nitrososphaera sp.]
MSQTHQNVVGPMIGEVQKPAPKPKTVTQAKATVVKAKATLKATKADVVKAQADAAKVAAQHDANVKKLALQIITDAKKLSAEIDSIARDVNKMGIRLHLCFASATDHATVHGDVTLARRALAAISGPEGSQNFIRVNAYRAWLIAYGPFEYRAKVEGEKDEVEGKTLFLDKNKRKTLKAERQRNKLKFHTRLMSETPEGLTPEPEWVPFNFAEALAALVTKAEAYETKQVKKMQKAGKPVTAAMRKEIDLSGITEAKKALAVIEGKGK